ncbi:VTT domain-containing protein [Clostridium sp. D2Q-11]|uniref:VTT domain-containing protein n=1 Tax=Anaeromonas frigoriresistens TaxID=2683708 RepID=A0A942UXV3_9FIRM|nr:VTT domain-containing protein [Anaeromonas frigoriresistens]MBS4540120.1 VTT domain-containing protein [Anaeromonas frigoriresistens]
MEELIIQFSKNLVSKNILLSYIFFFLSQALQVLFPPYPGDMVLILEGYLSEIAGVNIILVIINAISATYFSSVALYLLGNKEGEKILHSKIINRLFETDKVLKLRRLFDRFGSVVIIVSKFIPGIYSIAVLSAGVFKVERKVAYTSIFIITSIHHIALITLGKVLGENWTYVFRKIEMYNKQMLMLIIPLIFIYLIIMKIKKKIFD